MTDLEEIIEYWKKKYPSIYVNLWPLANGRFHGLMRNQDGTTELSADTIGELISQGENFLRVVTK